MNVNRHDARPASVEEVLVLVRESCRPLETEPLTLDAALGRVLREPACAPEDQPPFDRAAMDGYAVRLDDPGRQFRVVDEIHAGEWKPRQLERGEAVRISTGAALPGDGLQIVINEEVVSGETTIRVPRRDTGRNIRFRGEDARRGQVLVEAGTVLGPGSLALLASVGCTRPLVTRLPRVLHAVTGDEIVPPEQAPPPGQIRDSNSTLVRAFLNQWGVQPEQHRLPDDESRAGAVLTQSGVSTPDLLLVSGGASVGERDFTRRLLEHLGYTIRISKTNTRPGKPLIVAQRGGAIAFGLPGNPLAHFVCLYLYVRVALDRFSGSRAPSPFEQGQLATDLEADGNARETFWPARCSNENGAVRLRPLPWTSSGDLTSLATANALVRVPAGCTKLPRDAAIEFVPTRPFE